MTVQVRLDNKNLAFILNGPSYAKEAETILQDAGRSAELAALTVMGKSLFTVATTGTADAGNTGDGTVTAVAKISGPSVLIGDYNLDKFIMVGDRVLIKPKSLQDRTKTGLYLPLGVHEKEKIYSGFVLKVGPGYPIPAIHEIDEPWKNKSDEVKYVPLQPKEGDLAIYMQKSGWEIEFNKEKFIIIPHSAILMLIRDEDLFA